MDVDMSNGRAGPTWRILASVVSVVLFSGLAWWMTAIWAIANDTKDAVVAIRMRIDADDTALKMLQAEVTLDHDLLMRADYRASIDHDWISAQIHANAAIRRLHNGK